MGKEKKPKTEPAEEENISQELSLEERRKISEILLKAKNAFEKSNFGYSVELYYNILKAEPGNEEASQMFFPSSLARRQTKGTNPAIDVLSFFENIPLYVKWMIYKARNKNNDILFLLLEIAKKEPNNFPVLKQLGNMAAEMDLTPLAINSYKRFLIIKEDNMEVLKSLGRLYMKIDDREKAKEIFKKILHKSPFDSDASKGLKDISATTTIEKSKWDDKDDFRTKIRDENEAKLAEIESHLSQTEKELLMLIDKNEKLLQKNPQDLHALRALTDLYQKTGEKRKSLEHLKKLSTLQPGDADLARSVVQVEHSILATEEKSPEELKQFLLSGYRALTNQYPTNYKLRYDFGINLLETGEFDEAIGEFQKSVQSPNYKSESINQLGLCFESKKIYDLAINQFKNGIESMGKEMDDLKKDMTYNLARVLEKSGDGESALENYKKIYQVDISYKDVSKKIEEFYKKDKGSTSTTT